MSTRQPTGPARAIPLAAMRPDLAGGWPADARWLSEVAMGGGTGPALQQSSGTAIALRLRCGPGARLRARVTLAPEDWKLAAGAIVRATVRDAAGEETETWSGFVGGFWRPPARRWLHVDAPLGGAGGEEIDLVLTAEPAGLGAPAASRVLWGDPAIWVPGTPALPPLPPADERPPRRTRASTRTAAGAEPAISILTPVHDPDPAILADTLASVRGQTFRDWQLCLVDDGSRDPRVVELLRRGAADDERVRLVRRETPGGISAATNAALEMATGDFVALLDHDDLLAADALEVMAGAIGDRPDVDMLYSDEDLVENGRRVWLHLKPDWSPDFLRSLMYTCHLGVYRRSLVTEIGGFRSAFDGAQDYDLVLRLTERTDRIVHVPRVLYHWRAHERSAARNTAAKPYAYAAARRAIAEHARRAGLDADVHFGAARGEYRVVHRVDAAARAAVILPAPGRQAGLRRAVDSWLAGAGMDWELVLAGPPDAIAACAGDLPAPVRAKRLRTLETEPGLGRAALANRAARATTAEHLVLLDAPVETLTRGWLARLAGIVTEPGIGAVAPKTVSADGRIEHAGIVVDDGVPLPVLHGAEAAEPGPLGIARVLCNMSAVSGVVVTRRETLERMGGLEERLRELAEIDFCLRARDRGLRIVSAPDAIVRRASASPPVNDVDELGTFRARWRGRGADPYVNPGFARRRADFSVRAGV